MSIYPEPAKPISAEKECRFLRQALRHNPGVAIVRQRLALLLNQLDAFDETVALLTAPECSQLGFYELRALAWAYLALRADQSAYEVSVRALATAASDFERSRALSDQALALRRLDKLDAAIELLGAALELDPHNDEACERLTAPLLKRGGAGAVIALTDRLASKGAAHTRLLAARAAAFAQAGDAARARQVIGLPAFLYQQPISAPAGWTDLASFNAALAGELLTRPEMRYDRYNTSSENSWLVDAPAFGAGPAVRALLALVAETAERHSATLSGHPWAAARPGNAALRSWCVITRADGFEHWHTHPDGWMSGGYYVQVPRAVEEGEDERGCLAFGLPPGLVGEAAARRFGETRLRPTAGTLTLFPSHAHHRTFPHRDSGHRICVAFDVQRERRPATPGNIDARPGLARH